MRTTRRIAVYSSGDANEMLPHTAEETLHSYLRRHFDKVSKKRAGQFTEQKEAADEELILETPAVEFSGS